MLRVTVLALLLTLAWGQEEEASVKNTDIVKARVESCSGWRLNRLPEVKKFIFEDIPFFHNVEFKNKPGANPDLLLLNSDLEIVERIDLAKLNREECNDLLTQKGFYKKASPEEEVPAEFQEGPYRPREEL